MVSKVSLLTWLVHGEVKETDFNQMITQMTKFSNAIRIGRRGTLEYEHVEKII